MEISSLFIRVVFLVFPGIIGAKVYRKLRGRVEKKVWEDFAEILMFAVASYFILGIVAWPLRNQINVSAFRAFMDEAEPLDLLEISEASCIAVALAAVGSYAHRYKWVTRTARKLCVSHRSGDEDLWDFFHTMPGTDWVFVRDHKLDLVYYGWVKAFSDTQKERELILGDVDVFTNTDPPEKLYSTEVVYLSRERYDLTVELPPKPAEENADYANAEEMNDE